MRVHVRHHLGRRVRPGDREHARVRLADEAATVFAPRHPVTITLPFSASASPIASSDSATAASMKPQVLTDDEIRAVVRRGDVVALGPQLRQDHFRIDERLRTAERDEADRGCSNGRGGAAFTAGFRIARNERRRADLLRCSGRVSACRRRPTGFAAEQ
jgi:hypothetical protein